MLKTFIFRAKRPLGACRGTVKRFLLLLVCLLGPTSVHAQVSCYAVTPSGSGSQNGSTWGNALAGLPGTLTRGAIYYLADGNYGHSLTLNTASSGTTTVEIRKAQSYDFGQNGAVCSNNLNSDSSWSASTMGSSQAVWNSGGAGTIVNISMSYLTINGNGNGAATEIGCGGVRANPPSSMTGPAPNPAACGIKIDDSTCTSTATNGCDGGSGVMHGAGSNITWESIEWFGQGLNAGGNNNSETYFWATFGASDLSGVTITHSYLHNAGTTYYTVVSGGWINGSFDHNYCWGLFDGSTNHGEAIQLQGSNGPDVVHHNIFRDQQTNGDVVAVIGGTQSNMAFYDNEDFCTSSSVNCRHNDGIIGCFNSQICSNYLIYDNVFSGNFNCGWKVSGTMTVKNNLFYGCASVGMNGGTNTVDYNSYLNSNQSAVGSHDVSSNSAPNPFVSSTNLTLTSENALWNNRSSLGAPYDTDINGNVFTTDRGASQFGGTTQPPQPPTGLSTIVK